MAPNSRERTRIDATSHAGRVSTRLPALLYRIPTVRFNRACALRGYDEGIQLKQLPVSNTPDVAVRVVRRLSAFVLDGDLADCRHEFALGDHPRDLVFWRLRVR